MGKRFPPRAPFSKTFYSFLGVVRQCHLVKEKLLYSMFVQTFVGNGLDRSSNKIYRVFISVLSFKTGAVS